MPALSQRRSVVLPFLFEGTLVFGVLYLLWLVTISTSGLSGSTIDLGRLAVAAVPLALVLRLGQTTRRRFSGSPHQEIVLSSVLNLGLACVSAAIILMVYGVRGVTVAVVLAEGAFVLPLVSEGGRIAAEHLRLPGFTRERILVYGEGAMAADLLSHVSRNAADNYTLVGFVSDDPESCQTAVDIDSQLPLHVAGIDAIPANEVDRIVIALKEKRGRLPVRQLLNLRVQGVPIEDYTSFVERSTGRISVESLLPSWLIFNEGFKTSPALAGVKRALDFSLSLLLLVCTLPLMLLTAVVIKIDSEGPVFYTQTRSGKDGRPFRMIKFRSMVQNAESGGAQWAKEDDPRVTRVGTFIRKYRIDELPQVMNVLRGDMSFVGPRPERPEFVHELEQEIPYYTLRKFVRPGLTGWAQVKYRYGSSAEDTMEKLKYDLYYIKTGTPLMDLWICLFTIKVVLLGTGAR